MGVEGLLINFLPSVQPSTQTHAQFAIYYWHVFYPTSHPTIQPPTKTHVQSAICWHGFHPTSPLMNCPQKLMWSTHQVQVHFCFSFVWYYWFCLIRLQRFFFPLTIVNNTCLTQGPSYVMEKGKFILMLAGYHFLKHNLASSSKTWKKKKGS
jgi:hypothetical protein